MDVPIYQLLAKQSYLTTPGIKQRLLYGDNSKVVHAHGLMTSSPSAFTSIDSKLEVTCQKIWKVPKGFPIPCMHAPHDELCLNLLTIWENYCSVTINSWTHILNDQGTLGATTCASLTHASTKYKIWPLKLVFHTLRGCSPLCPSIIARNIATLIAADLHSLGELEIWSWNPIPATLTSAIPNTLDKVGYPTTNQPYTRTNKIIWKLIPHMKTNTLILHHRTHWKQPIQRLLPDHISIHHYGTLAHIVEQDGHP